ncbi:hypothetical protein BDZ45DRAFT_13217 [Acephala macrosclerotiorum]|nr:hypothetical protein BDZ45DRAFT_13217 [Acephala macrosclerotiorum]
MTTQQQQTPSHTSRVVLETHILTSSRHVTHVAHVAHVAHVTHVNSPCFSSRSFNLQRPSLFPSPPDHDLRSPHLAQPAPSSQPLCAPCAALIQASPHPASHEPHPNRLLKSYPDLFLLGFAHHPPSSCQDLSTKKRNDNQVLGSGLNLAPNPAITIARLHLSRPETSAHPSFSPSDWEMPTFPPPSSRTKQGLQALPSFHLSSA